MIRSWNIFLLGIALVWVGGVVMGSAIKEETTKTVTETQTVTVYSPSVGGTGGSPRRSP